ncbi:MAG: ABC transporter permease [Phycisphaerae bacterium]
MTLKRYIKLLWLFTRVSIQNDAAYRADFVAHAFMAVGQLLAELIGVWTVFSNTQSLAGWNAYEVLALLGVFRMMTGIIALLIAPNMRLIMDDIREGTLDFVLMMPISTQFYASTRRVVVWRLADVILGLALALYAATHLSGGVPLPRVLGFITLLTAGSAIIYAFWLVLATLAFWFTRITNIEMVFWNVFEAGRYPVDIYRPWLRWGLTYVIPLAFLTTFPAAALMGKNRPTALIIALPVAALALLLSSMFWRYGLRRYSGASA